jgi:PAS domain S-box-containing protein
VKNYITGLLFRKNQQQLTRQFRFALAGGLILLAGFLLLVGSYYLRSFQEQFFERTQNALFVVSEIKTSQIQEWREERLKDAMLLQSNTRLLNNTFRLFINPDSPYDSLIKSRINDELAIYTRFHPYEFFIVDGEGEQLISWPDQSNALKISEFSQYMSGDDSQIELVEFFNQKNENQAYLAMVIPLIRQNIDPIFVIALIDPFYGLYDAFKSDSSSTEALEKYFIVKGDEEYLTIDRSDEVSKDSLFIPLKIAAENDVFAPLLDDNSIMHRGVGFDGSKVLATLAFIPGTDWMIVIEMKEAQLLHSVKQRILVIIIMGIVFLLSIVGLIIVFARQQEIRMLVYSRENELLLDDLINNQPSGIFRLALFPELFHPLEGKGSLINHELPLKYLYVSKQHETITGISEKDVFENPKRLFDAIHPDDRQSFYDENFQCFESYKRFYWEGRLICNGQVKWVRFDSVPRLSPPDKIIWTGVVMDISLQKELEKEMLYRESFERLLTQLSSSFVSISSENFDKVMQVALERIGAFCFTERAYIFLLNDDGLHVQNTHEWCAPGINRHIDNFQQLPYSSIPRFMDQLKAFQPVKIFDVQKLSSNWSKEKSLLMQQGIKSLIAVPVISDEKLIGFVGFDSEKDHRQWKDFEIQLLKVFADLVYNAFEKRNSEQKLVESQQMLRIILDTIQVRVFWKDVDLRFRGSNMIFAQDAGFENPEDLVGLNDFDMTWQEQAEKFRADDFKVMKSGQPMLNFEEYQTDSFGTIKWVSTSKIPLKNKQGDIIGILGTYHDISERKINEALRNEVAIANQSAVFKQNFLANMSHEIRTPLTGVLGMIEILATTDLDIKQRDFLNTLKLSSENLREIINQILDYSKIEAGKVSLKNVAFETVTIFNYARKLYESSCKEDVELIIDIGPEIPAYIEADEQRLSQIINNLLSNAIKFTIKGQIIIRANVVEWMENNELIMKISVEDTGIGIREVALPMLFKPFGQVENEDKRHFDGTGLGLSICKELVALMKGEIGVESEKNKGSKFWFTIRTQKWDSPPSKKLLSYLPPKAIQMVSIFCMLKINR